MTGLGAVCTFCKIYSVTQVKSTQTFTDYIFGASFTGQLSENVESQLSENAKKFIHKEGEVKKEAVFLVAEVNKPSPRDGLAVR